MIWLIYIAESQRPELYKDGQKLRRSANFVKGSQQEKVYGKNPVTIIINYYSSHAHPHALNNKRRLMSSIGVLISLSLVF